MEGKNLKPYASTLSTLSICCSNALHLDLAESLLNQIEASPCARPYNAFFEACDIMVSGFFNFIFYHRYVKLGGLMRK